MEWQRCATTFHSVPFGFVPLRFVSFRFVLFDDVHRHKHGELV